MGDFATFYAGSEPALVPESSGNPQPQQEK